MRPASTLISFLSIACWCIPALAQTPGAATDVLAGSTQAIVVTTPNWSAVQGRLQQYERANPDSPWHAAGKPFDIVVGANGLGWGIGVVPTDGAGVRAANDPVKKEGDGKSPAGVFSLGVSFGYAAQPLPGLKMPYITLTPSIECVDDPRSKNYNRIVDRNAVTPDWNSSEHMRAAGESYVWGAVVNHNGTAGGDPPVPGGGSCVFLHIWHSQNQGTAGCTAMTKADLESLLVWLDPARKPLLVQLPEAAYERLADSWGLPRLVRPPH